MTVQVYDSKLRAVVPLQTRDEGRVAMYCCGPTVYNYIHIGNARTMVWFDAIRRYLAYRGYDVTYVMNYTDVDDKTIAGAMRSWSSAANTPITSTVAPAVDATTRP